jgi:hypothetical protein
MPTTRSWISSLSRACWSGEVALRRFENLLGGLLGAADHRAELAGDLGHLVAGEALAVQGGDLLLGAVDGVVDQVELDLELLALLDLRAISLQQRLRVQRRGCLVRRARRTRHLRADGAQLAHDLVVVRRRSLAVLMDVERRYLAGLNFLDAKALALDSHSKPPVPDDDVVARVF